MKPYYSKDEISAIIYNCETIGEFIRVIYPLRYLFAINENINLKHTNEMGSAMLDDLIKKAFTKCSTYAEVETLVVAINRLKSIKCYLDQELLKHHAHMRLQNLYKL